ncbi:hypothetical protein V8E53_009991 [Lactarius tabidus]
MVLGFGFGLRRTTWKSRGRRTLCVTASELNDDVLLNIFDWYRLYNTTSEDQGWNLERWWYKPIHVCRKWRHLILSSPTRLDLHLVCTYGIPVETMLSYSPPLPLIIYYPEIPAKISTADEGSAIFALQQNNRVRRIHVAAPTTVSCKIFKVMDCEFPMLERLSLHLSTESRAGLGLPEKLQAPLLRHLTLSNISLPIQSQLLRQAEGLITLQLWNIPASSEFHPAHLVAQLLGMSRLETLMVQFHTPIPKRKFESPAQPAPIVLPNLKVLSFRGSSTYLEGILARINTPLLSTLNVEFFNQLTFNLSRLLQFIRRTGDFRFRSVEMQFDKEFVSVVVDPHPERVGSYPFLVQVKCQPLGWQVACASQICQALEPLLAEVESLTLGFHMDGSVPWQDEIDLEKWHGLLRTFAHVKSLRLNGGLVGDLFRSLQLNEGELPLGLLPELKELVPNGREHADGSGNLTSIRLTVIAAFDLIKRDIFSLPNPFAFITTDGSDFHLTSIVKKTLIPYWNESFELFVRESSQIQIEVVDQRKLQGSDQGFLGSVSITVGDVLNLRQGRSVIHNLELQPGPNGQIVHGSLLFSLSTLGTVSHTPFSGAGKAIASSSTTNPTGTCTDGRLPLGWEWEGQSIPEGHPYFVDHHMRLTTSTIDAEVPQYKRDYQQKVAYFRIQPSMRPIADAICDVCVRRGLVFEDSFAAIMRRRPEDLRKELVVKFEGEDALEHGDVSREWFFILSHEMFNPSYALFQYPAHDNVRLQINPASGVNPAHLDYFKFIGRVLGLAVFHRCFLNAYFAPGFYKMVLNKKVHLKDLGAVDYELYKGLVWMLEHDVTNVFKKTFSVTEDRFGEQVVVELRPGGASQVVTESNKDEYVDLVVAHRIEGRITEQFNAFMEGLGDVLPLDLLRVFDEDELELLICGTTEIDMDDWTRFTDYFGYEKTDQVIEWFWACVRSWPAERKARLLQFTTGTPRVPVDGFDDLQGSDGPRHFTIEKRGHSSGLPRSHACINRLYLPPYEDYESLERKLCHAIEETEGRFGQE